MTARTDRQGGDYEAVSTLAVEAWQSYMDQTLNNKAIWKAVSETFREPKHQEKVYNAVQRTYMGALDFVIGNPKPMEDIVKLQTFIEKWMEDSLTRAWNMVTDPDGCLTE